MTPGAPPGEERRGRLVFAGEVSRLRLTGGAPGADLLRIWPVPGGPRLRLAGDLVVVRFPRPDPAQERLASPEGPAGVTLGAGVPWQIAFRGPASHVAADLRGLALSRLEFDGGAARVTVALPAPLGTVPVRILGGASHVAIHRPPGVPVRLRVDGGATAVTLDGQRVGVAGGDSPCTPPGTRAPPGATRSPSPEAPTCWPWGWTRHSAKAPEGLDRDQPQDDRALRSEARRTAVTSGDVAAGRVASPCSVIS